MQRITRLHGHEYICYLAVLRRRQLVVALSRRRRGHGGHHHRRQPATLGVGGQESRGQRQRLHVTGPRSGRDEAVAAELDSSERTVDTQAASRGGRDVARGLKI